MVQPASTNRRLRSAWVASRLPLPGSARPSASVRQFIEFAVNMPEQEPQVGHAERSMTSLSASVTLGSAPATMAVIRSARRMVPSVTILPASIGPPETNTTGILRRIAAISMPGVILSQLLMQTRASAQCAFTMYSTASAINSRDGRLYSMPEWPMAMPSSTAMVLNSLATPPAAAISPATSWPRSLRWTWPGTNWVKELAIAMIGLPKSPSCMPVARHRLRAPAMLRPCVVVRERYAGIGRVLAWSRGRFVRKF